MAQQDVIKNGMLFEVTSNSLRTVAGRRPSFSHLQSGHQRPDTTTQIILPRKGVLELSKLLNQSDASVTLVLSSNHLRAPGLKTPSPLSWWMANSPITNPRYSTQRQQCPAG